MTDAERVGPPNPRPEHAAAVHILRHGKSFCGGFSGVPPKRWPPGHSWTGAGTPEAATCPDCLAVARTIGSMKEALDAVARGDFVEALPLGDSRRAKATAPRAEPAEVVRGPPEPREPWQRWYAERIGTFGPPIPQLIYEPPGQPLYPRHAGWMPWCYGPRELAADDARTLSELIAARARGEDVGVPPAKDPPKRPGADADQPMVDRGWRKVLALDGLEPASAEEAHFHYRHLCRRAGAADEAALKALNIAYDAAVLELGRPSKSGGGDHG